MAIWSETKGLNPEFLFLWLWEILIKTKSLYIKICNQKLHIIRYQSVSIASVYCKNHSMVSMTEDGQFWYPPQTNWDLTYWQVETYHWKQDRFLLLLIELTMYQMISPWLLQMLWQWRYWRTLEVFVIHVMRNLKPVQQYSH